MNVQVKKEEQRLKEDFGEEYLQYMKHSYRFLPVKKIGDDYEG